MGAYSLGMNQKTLQQLLPNTDYFQKLDNVLNSYKKTMPMLDAMSNSTIIQDALSNTAKLDFTLPQVKQLQQLDNWFNSYKKTMPMLDAMSNSTIIQDALSNTAKLGFTLPQVKQLQQLDNWFNSYKKTMPMLEAMSSSTVMQDALRMVQIPTSTVQILSTIDMDEIRNFLEEREIQEEIHQEITAIQEETDVKSVIDRINDWALKILNAPTALKENAPALYLVLCFVLPFAVGNLLLPAMQDIWKEKVLHVSEFTEEKPKENAKQLKQSMEKDFGIALSAVNQIRVTNRETPVFRSYQRISGSIDSIPCNKPVIIIEKKRNWSFIMYVNTLGEETNGWVFTGNLAR
ncbi:hypothetical protein CN917_21265 [Bacillus thuringiensis]|uniref:hypothetical protein n=1 Tax=Bacillus cereus group TaxID=86661 RepID=UPI000BFCAFE7|nr:MULTISPECIES: hypothetical protein [Bacillus cereus group]MED2614697.1 hypothetical protein [Bacillus toyonensis]MED3313529.1 hypothetical protein [Bacillus thuringiensis]PGL18328.1 hypothetical protein CN917_21265 [Bacillus thuringiensis]